MSPVSSEPPDEAPGAALRRRLREMREAAGLSQGELGTRLGREQSWASRIERGSGIELHEIEAWARECGVQLRVEWGASGGDVRLEVPLERVDVIERLVRLPPADLQLLSDAAVLLDSALTARKRLAFEVEMWSEEARAASVSATVASAAAQLSAVLQGGDADALRLLQQRVGLLPAVPPAASRKASQS